MMHRPVHELAALLKREELTLGDAVGGDLADRVIR